MGIVHRGIPKKLALQLRDRYNLRYFVETGTHVGRTAIWAAREFERVWSFELSLDYVRKARSNCKGLDNVLIAWVNSGNELGKTLPIINNPCLIWLDAHWSSDLGYERPTLGECPLLDELACILQDKHLHVILIDDARLFTEAPPKPHAAEEWPTMADIEQLLQGRYALSIQDDVIVGVPHG